MLIEWHLVCIRLTSFTLHYDYGGCGDSGGGVPVY